MTSRLLPALVCVTLVACGGGYAASGGGPLSTPSTTVSTQTDGVSPPRVLTPSNDGGVYTLPVGRTVGLVVPDPHAPAPERDGTSIDVVEVVNVQASGRREWELRAVAVGQTVLRAAGSTPYRLTFNVVPR